MSYQEIFAGHQMNSEEFYKKFFDDDDSSHFLIDQKKKLSKVCAFTHIKLKVPVRSKQCTQIKCVYEYDNIKILFEDAKQNNRTSEIQCLICDQTIKQEDLFYDSELVKALKKNVRCYVQKKKDSQNFANGNKQKNYIIVDKLQKELVDEIQELDAGQLQLIENDQNFQILSILGLTLYKQRMETLIQLRDSNNQQFKNFGIEQLELEKKQYNIK